MKVPTVSSTVYFHGSFHKSLRGSTEAFTEASSVHTHEYSISSMTMTTTQYFYGGLSFHYVLPWNFPPPTAICTYFCDLGPRTYLFQSALDLSTLQRSSHELMTFHARGHSEQAVLPYRGVYPSSRQYLLSRDRPVTRTRVPTAV